MFKVTGYEHVQKSQGTSRHVQKSPGMIGWRGVRPVGLKLGLSVQKSQGKVVIMLCAVNRNVIEALYNVTSRQPCVATHVNATDSSLNVA